MTSPPVLDALPVQLRLIQRAAAGTTVLGATLAAQAPAGVNGVRGYQSGSYESALSERGEATVMLPNTTGADGRLHRTRFDCLTDDDYMQGDEWIEVWHGTAGRGRLLFVGTPTDARISRTTITLTLADGTGPLDLERETAAGFWAHAPRDVFEHYTKAWKAIVADDFTGGVDTGKWTTLGTITNQATNVKLTPTAAFAGASITAKASAWEGVDVAVERAWRVEVTYNRSLTASAAVQLQMIESGGDCVLLFVDTGFAEAGISTSADDDITIVKRNTAAAQAAATLAIEMRDRWMLFYIDGELVHSMEDDLSQPGLDYFPDVQVANNAVNGSYIEVENIILRRLDPYLIRGASKGDYRLPGTLPSGGLRGTYFDESDLRSYGDTTAAYYRRALAPTRKPYARRQDATVNFPTANPPTWMPPSPPSGAYFSVRWTGAIYLDLATADVTLRLTNLDNAGRLWVGKTMYPDMLIDQWTNPTGAPFTLTTGSMRTHLGGSVSGWYPIRIDFSQGLSPGGIIFQQSIGGGAYAVVPATSLSPYGIYEAEVRYDSHAEQLRAIVTTYGLQYRCEPKSLESGSFPGEVLPKVRVGRDTSKVLSPSESTEAERTVSAQEAVQTLLADAAGLADQGNAAQLTSEAVDFASVFPAAVADRHMMVLSGYESLSDITDPALLATRLAAMLGLRSSPWEEVGARPRGSRELIDTFPLTASLALFAWEPGDGIRIIDEQIGVADDSPRQIIAPSWPFVPDGLGVPSVRFRQRPRSQQDALREIVRAVLLPQRNYQGQLSTVPGTWTSGASADYSRVALPIDLADVVRCDLVVGYKSDSSTWSIKDLGAVTLTAFATSGRVDLFPYLYRRTDGFGSSGQAMVVQVTGGTGTAEVALELVVRI